MPDRSFLRRSPADGYRIGIVNPTTLIAKELATILVERNFPSATITLLDTVGDASGTLTELDGAAMVITPASDDAFSDLDLVFFTGPASVNEQWIARLGEEPFIAIDLSSGSLEQADHPVIAGVNSLQISVDDGLLTSPDPFVVPVVLLIDTLRRKLSVETAAASVTRPASELGQDGIDELFQQTIHVLNLEKYSTDVFGRQAAFAIYPPPDASAVEKRASAAARSILGNGLSFSLQLLQGPLFHGHSIALFAQLGEEVTEQRVREILGAAPSLYVVDQGDPVSTIDGAGKDHVIIGSVVMGEANPRGVWIWAAADNLRRSSALNAALVAEDLVERFGPVSN
ncbi:MAG TPA: Asd/ArgC dimerization domain-containing protein [Thermoanaerobaculia bacterium]|nr:Asd/ArgC dimerization domain-containing protein [Thermoanaerobaculia bacterium]